MMTTLKRNLLAGIVALLGAGAASAEGVNWDKDPVKDFKAEMSQQKPVVPAVAAIRVKENGDEQASTKSERKTALVNSRLLPFDHAKGCLKPGTELVIDGGRVGADYSCCQARPIDQNPSCTTVHFDLPQLRYDANRKAILWGSDIVATHGNPEDHGPYWKFYMAEGFALTTRVVPMSLDGRPAADLLFVVIKRTPEPAPSQPHSHGGG